MWIVGWMGISMLVGSFFEIPLKTTCLIGALLGPLGFMLTLIVGFLEGGADEKFSQVSPLAPVGIDWDPFA